MEVAGIDEFVFERGPQSLDEQVIERAAVTVHADSNAALLQRRQELGRSKLRALIGVPDAELTEAESRVERGAAEALIQRIRELPGQHEAAESVHDRDQIQKPL